MHTMMFSTCPNECAQIWSYAPKSSKKAKKNDDDDDDKEDVEGLEVNYVYVGIVCVLYILLVWATTYVNSRLWCLWRSLVLHYCVLTSLPARVECRELEVRA